MCVLFKRPLETPVLSLCVIAARLRSVRRLINFRVLQNAACVFFKLIFTFILTCVFWSSLNSLSAKNDLFRFLFPCV